MSLLVVGTVAFDTIESPFGKREKIIGGAATYISLAASYFNDNVRLVGVIGDDFPQSALDQLEERNINLEGLQVKENEKTFFWEGKYAHDLNSRTTLTTELNVLEDFNPVLPDSYKNSQYIMLGNLTPSVQRKVLDQLRKKPRLICLDTMNFWIDSTPDDLKDLLSDVDILIINDEEARLLSGEYSLVKAAKKIREMGASHIAIKKGEHGALLFYDAHVFFAPALPLSEVYDPTGAGDTFAGGFLGYLSKTEDLSFENMKRALIYGSAMASFVVEDFGIDGLLNLDYHKIAMRLDKFVQLVNFDLDLDPALSSV